MDIQVLFFASLKEQVGSPKIDLALQEEARVSDLKNALVERYPQLAPAMHSVLISVNQEFAFDEDPIPAYSEVALFPPVSGGAEENTIVRVTEDRLNFDDLIAQITFDTTGAACVFSGMVRGKTRRGNPHQTDRLEYEAYIPMAEGKMRQVAEEIRSQWPEVEGIAIVQRIGVLDPGTPTVCIACSAAHRDSGVFEAARYGIDRLKEIVPVWKKEISASGEEWVEGEYLPTSSDKMNRNPLNDKN